MGYGQHKVGVSQSGCSMMCSRSAKPTSESGKELLLAVGWWCDHSTCGIC